MTASNGVAFIATLALAIIAGTWLDESGPILTKKILLRDLEAQVQYADQPLRVAVGYNGCLDVVAGALGVFQHTLQDDADVAAVPRVDHPVLFTVSEFQETFLHHFEAGSAAERVVADGDLFQQLLDAANTAEDSTRAVGGNAALMAVRFSALGATVLLGAPVGPELGKLLAGGDKPVGLASAPLDTDEVHLILEYPKGASVGNSAPSPRANRFIVTHDRSNGRLASLESFHKTVNAEPSAKYSSPDLVVLAGLHMVDQTVDDDAAYRPKRIADVAAAVRALRQAHPSVAVHLELASLADAAHMRLIADTVFPVVDSIGLNEQELAFLYTALDGPAEVSGLAVDKDAISGTSDAPPSPQAVASAVRYILDSFPELSRVHYHALQMHIVAQRDASSVWKKPVSSSAAAGSAAATLRACGVSNEKELHGNDLDILADLWVDTADPLSPPRPAATPGDGDGNASSTVVRVEVGSPVVEWKWGEFAFAMAPVLVCKAPVQTVGLGDTISASGLAAHL